MKSNNDLLTDGIDDLDQKQQLDFKKYEEKLSKNLPLEAQINVLQEVINSLIPDGELTARVIKYKLSRYRTSKNSYQRLYALNKIISDGKGIEVVPEGSNVSLALENTHYWISEALAKRFVKKQLETKVENIMIDKQEKYMDEIRLGIIKKSRGAENSKTLKKYADLEVMDSRIPTKNIQDLLRPKSFSEIVGQERAIKSLLSKMVSPYPQHIILYGPPGVGKTTAARLALEEAKKVKNTPFKKDAKFVEVDGTTLRWDPREITNPLLGSVHDPIYQGSKRDLAETGIPEPKPGLVTEAHGGVLFIDEIGELDAILQNKLLKVLEDKRVEFSSSYYDPDDENTPKYIKYLFDKGAPADFVLIGATTKEPAEINPALRSRCTEVYFEPLAAENIEEIVRTAAKKIKVKLEDGVPELISKYTIEGRRAVNILSDAYGYAIYDGINNAGSKATIKIKDVEEIISVARLVPYEKNDLENTLEVGHIFGLGVSGFLGSTIEIEATAFPTKEKGKGSVRFNETAGSMAKDSVFNAASVIRKVTDIDITDYNIHVNIIGGGRIDGPSAGAAITICIISALLDKPIKQNIAVTGEISLRGMIKPVGGIYEKIYGARRKGIELVLIPKDNIKEAPTDLKDINIKAVSDIKELMKYVF